MSFTTPPAFQFGAPTDWRLLNNALGQYREGIDNADQATTNKLAGELYAQGKNKEAAALAAGRGDLTTALAFQKADREQKLFDQQSAQQKLDYKNAVAKTFGGVAQNISDRLAKNPNDASAIADYNAIVNHPDYKDHFASTGVSASDPLRGAQTILMHARPYQDPLSVEAKQAEIAKDKAQAGLYTAQADAGNYIPLPENSRGILDKKKGVILGAETGDGTQRKFDEHYAKEVAPKAYQEASKAYTDANDAHMTYKTMLDLAPYAKTGFSGPVPPEAMLTLRKIGASMGVLNADTIAPTEIYKVLAQKGVFELTKSLKPASNLDMIASEKATASLQSDPTTLPVVLPMLMRIQERSMLLRQAEMQAYKSGRPPNTSAIMAEIDKRVPLLNINGQAGQIDSEAGGPRVTKPVTDRLGQATPPAAEPPPQAQGWTPEDLASARPGQKTPNGKFIFGRDGKLHPVAGDLGTERNPHEIGLFSGPDLKEGEFAIWNGKLYQQRGKGFGSLVPVERQ